MIASLAVAMMAPTYLKLTIFAINVQNFIFGRKYNLFQCFIGLQRICETIDIPKQTTRGKIQPQWDIIGFNTFENILRNHILKAIIEAESILLRFKFFRSARNSKEFPWCPFRPSAPKIHLGIKMGL